MPSTLLFIAATLLLSLNFFRLFGLAVSDWLYLSALGLALVETLMVERRHLPCWWRNRFLWAVVPILFGAIISTMNSRYWDVALSEIFQQIFVATLFTSLVWIMVRRGKTDSIILAFIFSGAFTAGIAIFDYLTGSRVGPALSGTPNLLLWGRYAGTLGHPNKLGYFLTLTTLLSVGRIFAMKPARMANLKKLGWAVLILIQLFGLYLSSSMTAYLGLLVGFVVMIISSKSLLFQTAKLAGFAAATAVLLFTFSSLFNLVVFDQAFSLKDSPLGRAFDRVRSTTAQSRVVIYEQAWDQIARNPWFGVGYDQISTSGVSSTSRYLDFSVHNTLLQVWYTGGFFALLGWLGIYLSIAWMVITVALNRERGKTHLFMLTLAAAALSILFMDQFQDAIYQREKWLVIGLLAGFVWNRHYLQPLTIDSDAKPKP